MKLLISLILLAFIPSLALSQDPSQDPSTDNLRSLAIDRSTPEEAIKLLGQPHKETINKFVDYDVSSKWLSPTCKQKVFRYLEYKNVEGSERVTLTFLEDKLVRISFHPTRRPDASAISRIYGLVFSPKIAAVVDSLDPEGFEKNLGKIFPRSYPPIYSIISITPTTFVSAQIDNGGVSSITRNSTAIRESGDFPGKATRIQIVSRRLENRQSVAVD